MNQSTLEVLRLRVRVGYEHDGQFHYVDVDLAMNTDEKLTWDVEVPPELISPAFQDALNKVMSQFCAVPQKFEWVHFGQRD